MSYREKYNRIGSKYDILESPLERYFEPLRKKAVSLVRGKVLEIGIGTGKTLKYYPMMFSFTQLMEARRCLK